MTKINVIKQWIWGLTTNGDRISYVFSTIENGIVVASNQNRSISLVGDDLHTTVSNFIREWLKRREDTNMGLATAETPEEQIQNIDAFIAKLEVIKSNIQATIPTTPSI